MRQLLTTIALLAITQAARADQITLAPVARQSITFWPAVYWPSGYNLVTVGFDSAADVVWRGMMRFDLSAVPPGSQVNSVLLRMTPSFPLFIDWTPFHLHRISTAWVPGVATNWYQPWSAGGGDFAPSSASTTTPIGSQTLFQGPLVTADVQTWIDAPATNHGWLVRDPMDWAEATYHFIELLVDFTPPCAAPTTYCVSVPNSTGQSTSIGSTGSTNISAGSFALVATGMPPGAPGMFFFGSQQQQTPWGNGFRCVAGTLHRIPPVVVANAQGSVMVPLGFTSSPGSIITPGSTWNFQLYHRDVAGGGAGFNSSNGLHATFCN